MLWGSPHPTFQLSSASTLPANLGIPQSAQDQGRAGVYVSKCNFSWRKGREGALCIPGPCDPLIAPLLLNLPGSKCLWGVVNFLSACLFQQRWAGGRKILCSFYYAPHFTDRETEAQGGSSHFPQQGVTIDPGLKRSWGGRWGDWALRPQVGLY